jgi:preprotein translocase subunit SecY
MSAIPSSLPEPAAIPLSAPLAGPPGGSLTGRAVLFTLVALLVCRLTTYIPIPGVDSAVIAYALDHGPTRMLAPGDAIRLMTICGLGLTPYVSSWIIVGLLAAVSSRLRSLRGKGAAGRKALNEYVRYGTLILAAVQSYGVALGLEAMHWGTSPVVQEPGYAFRLVTVITLTASTMLLVWLGEQITARGVGNGIPLIIFSGIVANLPYAIGSLWELGQVDAIPNDTLVFFAVVAVALVGFIVFMERAQRRLLVQYPKREMGNRIYGGEVSHLPLKLNPLGIVAPVFAATLLRISAIPRWAWLLSPNATLAMAMLVSLYLVVAFDAKEIAENLRAHGGFIPGIRPGKDTAAYLRFVASILSVIGAAYLTIVAVVPGFLAAHYPGPVELAGPSLLIVVIVSLNMVERFQASRRRVE